MQAVMMPQLGLTMTEGLIVDWLKQTGDAVRKGEAIAEVETEKVTYAIESPEDGVLVKIIWKEGETVPVAETIGWIGQLDEDIPDQSDGPSTPQRESNAPPIEQANADSAPLSHDQHDVRATPLAKRMAREAAVVLDEVRGTGPYGRIQAADVAEMAQSLPSGKRIELREAETSMHDRRFVPHSTMREAIARHMSESWRTIPHVTLHRSMPAYELLKLRERLSVETGRKGSITAVIVWLVARVLVRYPYLNAMYDDRGLWVSDAVHIGVATELDQGLLVPVIRDAQSKTISEIAKELLELSSRGRDRNLHPREVEGGTFTISTLGTYGIDEFTPIIMSPQTGILGVGRLVTNSPPPDREGSRIRVSLSFDHRAVDGAYGAQFLAALAECFSDPLRILI